MSKLTLEEIIREEVRKANLYPILEDKYVNEILNLVAKCSEPIDYAHIALLCLAIRTSIEKSAA